MVKELKDMGLSCAKIAKEMGVTRQSVHLWFSGKRFPNANSIKNLSEALTKLTKKEFTKVRTFILLAKVYEKVKKEKGA